ncbi:hypothetical protein PV350_09935 [Streptomyces sp. PA03-6a]|nr:hypothetical protein [Streptomyces sp. PA03-6a]
MSAAEQPLTWEERKAAEALERGDTVEAERWMRVKADVDLAPPLSPAQIAKLRVLLATEIERAQAA